MATVGENMASLVIVLIFVGSGAILLYGWYQNRIQTVSRLKNENKNLIDTVNKFKDELNKTRESIKTVTTEKKSKRELDPGILDRLRSLNVPVIQVSPDYTQDEKIGFKLKAQIVLRNEGEQPIHIKRGYWIADGNVPLELPDRLTFKLETDKGTWSEGPSTGVYVRPHQKFTTWIGLREKLSDNEFLQARRNKGFGTLALEIDGYNEDQKIRI